MIRGILQISTTLRWTQKKKKNHFLHDNIKIKLLYCYHSANARFHYEPALGILIKMLVFCCGRHVQTARV